MLKNKLVVAGIVAGLSITSMSALADTLTLTNDTSSAMLFVNCNGSFSLPLIPEVEYKTIVSMFPKNSAHPNQYACVFNSFTSEIGTATLRLTPGNPPQTAQVLVYAPTPPNSVAITPVNAISQPVPDIIVTLS